MPQGIRAGSSGKLRKRTNINTREGKATNIASFIRLHIAESRRRKAAFFFLLSFSWPHILFQARIMMKKIKWRAANPKRWAIFRHWNWRVKCLENVYSPSLYLKNHRDLGWATCSLLYTIHRSMDILEVLTDEDSNHIGHLKLGSEAAQSVWLSDRSGTGEPRSLAETAFQGFCMSVERSVIGIIGTKDGPVHFRAFCFMC